MTACNHPKGNYNTVITPSCIIVLVGTVDLELLNEIFFKSSQK
jgi:hypothetical protein